MQAAIEDRVSREAGDVPTERGAHERRPWAQWLVGGALLLLLAVGLPLDRTQEARVLETARAMAEEGGRSWIVPTLNGAVRLHKPPLAYWLSAWCYEVLGVHTWSGRLPGVAAAWMTLWLLWRVLRWQFNGRAAYLGAGMLGGALLFQHYGHVAETDVLSMVFVTASVAAMWRAIDAGETDARGRNLWFRLSAVPMALEAISKGPPAAYPLLFLIGAAWTLRRWRVVGQWARSGAPLIFLVIAAPWWIVALMQPQAKTVANELSDLSTGRDHGGFVLTPIGHAMKAALPWSGVALLAAAVAAMRWRQDRAARMLVMWNLAVLAPLLAIPQKQEHYMMPMLPALLGLAGWGADVLLRDERGRRALGWVVGLSAACAMALGPGLAVAGRLDRGAVVARDVWVGAAAVVAIAPLFVVARRRGLERALRWGVVSWAIVMALVLGVWGPTLKPISYPAIAKDLRVRYGDGPYLFYGPANLRIVFELRRTIPVAETEHALTKALAAQPDAVVLYDEKRSRAKDPPKLVRRVEYPLEERVLRVYRGGTP